MWVTLTYYDAAKVIFSENNVYIENINDAHRKAYNGMRNNRLKSCSMVTVYDIFENIVTAIDVSYINSYELASTSFHNKVWNAAIDSGKLTPQQAKELSNPGNVFKEIFDSSKVCYHNAVDLLNDALFLFDNGKNERAGSIAVLSFEEFGKSLLLFIAQKQKLWNSSLFNEMKKHNTKQAVMMSAIDISHSDLFMNAGLHAINSFPIGKVSHIIKEYHNKQVLDKIKQSLLYTKVNKNGTCISPKKAQDDSIVGYLILLCIKSMYLLDCVLYGMENDFIVQHIHGTTISHRPFPLKFGCDYTIHWKDGYDIDIPSIGINDELMIRDVIRPALHIANKLPYDRHKIKTTECLRDSWKRINEIIDVKQQIESKMRKLKYPYSQLLDAINIIIGSTH